MIIVRKYELGSVNDYVLYFKIGLQTLKTSLIKFEN